MSNPSQRKLRKKKQRERAIAKKLHEQRQHRIYKKNFPTPRFSGDANPEFRHLIQRTLESIDLRDRRLFHPTETQLYKLLKRNPETIGCLRHSVVEEKDPGAFLFSIRLGDLVFSKIPKVELLRFIPYNDVEIAPAGAYIQVHFRSLLRTPSPGGTIYYSRRKPTIKIDGEQKIVGWTQHAIERVCERYGPRWQTYNGLGEIFAVFDKLQTYERCDLYGDQLGFTFFEECVEPFFTGEYVPEILGGSPIVKPFFRVGYCPAAIYKDFVVAKTFLFPGYRNTPEYGTILRSTLPWPEKRAMIDKATVLDLDTLQQTGDFSLIKFFHDNGVPQVIERE